MTVEKNGELEISADASSPSRVILDVEGVYDKDCVLSGRVVHH